MTSIAAAAGRLTPMSASLATIEKVTDRSSDPVIMRAPFSLLNSRLFGKFTAWKQLLIKIDGELLTEIERAKPPGQSATAYVRTVLRKNLESHKIREAAAAYRTFVESPPEERECLDEWERADLATTPTEKLHAS